MSPPASDGVLYSDVHAFLHYSTESLWQYKWTSNQSNKSQVAKSSVQLRHPTLSPIGKDWPYSLNKYLLRGGLTPVCHMSRGPLNFAHSSYMSVTTRTLIVEAVSASEMSVPESTMKCPRRWPSSYSSLWEPEISWISPLFSIVAG